MRAFFEWWTVTVQNIVKVIGGEPTKPYVPSVRYARGPYSAHQYVTVDENGYFGVSCVVCKTYSWVAEMKDFEAHILRRWYWSGSEWYCERHKGGRRNG